MGDVIRFVRKSKRTRLVHNWFGANTGEVIQFVPRSERERARLIREARAIYESIFPPADRVSARQDTAPLSRTLRGADANPSDGILLS